MTSKVEKAEKDRDASNTSVEYLLKKIADKDVNPITEHVVKQYIQILDRAKTKLEESYDRIVGQGVADMDPYNKAHFAILDKVVEAHSELQTIKDSFSTPSPVAGSGSKSDQADVRLPRLTLPTFNGEIQNWMSFHDMFCASVHHTSLKKVQKLTYLRSALTGEASRQINSLPITDDNYDTAWDLLTQRYHNERELFFAILGKLIGQPIVPGNSAKELRALIDVSKECIHSLESLQLPVDHWDAIFLYHIATKLDNMSREMWEQTLTTTTIPPLKEFMVFLEQRARALVAGGTTQTKSAPNVNQGRPGHPQNHRRAAFAHHGLSVTCRLCKGDHATYKCNKFISMKVIERCETVKKFALCYNCIGDGHSQSKCPSQGTCRICKGRHHTLLHRDKPPAAPTEDDQSTVLAQHTNINHWNQGMLATAVVKVRDRHGHFHLCRAFLDGGSTASFISESCIRRLGLSRTQNSAQVLGIASTAIGTAKGITSLQLTSHFSEKPTYAVQALVLPSVTTRLPIHKCDPSKWTHLDGLRLADPLFHRPDSIDILLGADIFYTILLNETKSGIPGCPKAIKTTFGWIVAGETKSNSAKVIVNITEVDIDQQLRKLWEIETVSNTRTLTKEERDCEDHFRSTHTINSNGRFVVSLPCKRPVSTLGSSRDMAVRQLKQLEGRFIRVPERHIQYRQFMEEYLRLGHMEEIAPEEIFSNSSPSCYIPHHFILKESSRTTKLRVVFNASFKTSSGISLNDVLMVGPTIQDTLTDILMRFRINRIAFSADIAKMYRQVLVTPSDANLQRIVWRDSPTEPIKDYRLLTITYGTGPAPFLATRVLQQLATNHETEFPLAFQPVMRDIYVDDLLSGAGNLATSIETVSQINKLVSKAGMEFRQWCSNSPELLSSIPSELRATQQLLPLEDEADPTVKTLGIFWDTQQDTITFKVNIDLSISGSRLTKRNVLSEISKIFDPLGFLSPVIITGRILIQQLWKLQIEWDDSLPVTIQQQWLTYRDSLYLIEDITIPRCINPTSSGITRLAGFCDASEKAYAAVVYLCVYSSNQPPLISIVASKIRVAPAKTVSLPRLELCGAVLLSNLIQKVQTNLNLTNDSTTLWTDSTVVLSWIKAPPSTWKVFVANRITEIQERTPSSLWRHVPGIDNPADCASRGINPSELKSHPLWWNGSSFLQSQEFDCEPPSLSNEDLTAMKQEERSEVVILHAIMNENSLLHGYSSLWKLKRITATILRFRHNCLIKMQVKKKSYPTMLLQLGPLTPLELDAALLRWIRIVQSEIFAHDLLCLSKNSPLHPKSQLRSLNPFIDENQILRVGGRLRNANLAQDHRQPILLPRFNYLSKLIIDSEHLRNLHAGPTLLLSILHRRFWILGARNAVRHHVRQCVTCTRISAVTLKQFMGDFPAARVTPSRPFQKCGVDYAGPFLIKPISPRSKTTIKAYMAIFICFCTHAIHLEVVSALSTAAFIPALRRFISRRGKPTDIYSDCGTNFVGAANEIREVTTFLKSEIHNQQIANELAIDGIHWHFNPPGAPHFGGLWEAGVKSVKFHLKRVIGLARLTYEEFATVITQIEAILNSRPLTPLSTDPNDLTALTPGHFLIGSPLIALPEVDLRSENTGRLSRWQHVQQLQQHFWHRWSNEFIARLQQRPKWQNHCPEIKITDMVIIKDDRLPPLKWRLGRVIDIHPGPDGLTRVVTLRTAFGEVKQPIAKLCLLPIDDKSISHNLNQES